MVGLPLMVIKVISIFKALGSLGVRVSSVKWGLLLYKRLILCLSVQEIDQCISTFSFFLIQSKLDSLCYSVKLYINICSIAQKES